MLATQKTVLEFGDGAISATVSRIDSRRLSDAMAHSHFYIIIIVIDRSAAYNLRHDIDIF